MSYLDLTIIAAYLAGTVLFGAWFTTAAARPQVLLRQRPQPALVGRDGVDRLDRDQRRHLHQRPRLRLQHRLHLSPTARSATSWAGSSSACSSCPRTFAARCSPSTSCWATGSAAPSSSWRRACSWSRARCRTASACLRRAWCWARCFSRLPGSDDVARAWLPGADPAMGLLVASVVVLGVAMIVYTFLGGMTALIWTDVIQLGIYLVGAGAAIVVLLQNIPGGVAEVMNVATAQGKLHVLDFAFDVTRGYTFWSGVIGGAFLTTATHGTDQFMVQRYLCSRSPGRRAQGAAGQRRLRAGAVLHLPGHRPAALRVLHGPRRRGAWGHHRRRPRADRPRAAPVHREPPAGRAGGPGVGGDSRRRDVLVAQRVGRGRRRRLLHAVHAASEGRSATT